MLAHLKSMIIGLHKFQFQTLALLYFAENSSIWLIQSPQCSWWSTESTAGREGRTKYEMWRKLFLGNHGIYHSMHIKYGIFKSCDRKYGDKLKVWNSENFCCRPFSYLATMHSYSAVQCTYCTALHLFCTCLHCTATLHSTTKHCSVVGCCGWSHSAAQCISTVQYSELQYIILSFSSLHGSPLHCTALHCTFLIHMIMHWCNIGIRTSFWFASGAESIFMYNFMSKKPLLYIQFNGWIDNVS